MCNSITSRDIFTYRDIEVPLEDPLLGDNRTAVVKKQSNMFSRPNHSVILKLDFPTVTKRLLRSSLHLPTITDRTLAVQEPILIFCPTLVM